MRGILAITFASTFVIGCGGSEEPPKPLSRHFDEMYIAAIPVDAQKASFDAQHEWTVSRAEDAKANADLNEATMQLGIARNDQKAAHLAVENAVAAKKTAEKSADTNRENQAVKDMHTAEDNEKANKERVHYLTVYVDYMRKYTRYTLANMYFHEAKFEATKAQIAKQNNIAPRGVSYDWYPSQLQERQKRADKERARAEKHKEATVAAREAWLKIQKQADTESGHQTTAWDPMMNRPEAATAGAGEIQQMPTPKSGPVAPPPAPPAPPPAPAPAPEGGGTPQ
jgi:hypothetical protein